MTAGTMILSAMALHWALGLSVRPAIRKMGGTSLTADRFMHCVVMAWSYASVEIVRPSATAASSDRGKNSLKTANEISYYCSVGRKSCCTVRHKGYSTIQDQRVKILASSKA